METPVQTSSTRVSTSLGEESADLSSGPHRYKTLEELYNETEVMDMLDELMLLKVEEPVAYTEAAKEQEWRDAMNLEFETIVKNNT